MVTWLCVILIWVDKLWDQEVLASITALVHIEKALLVLRHCNLTLQPRLLELIAFLSISPTRTHPRDENAQGQQRVRPVTSSPKLKSNVVSQKLPLKQWTVYKGKFLIMLWFEGLRVAVMAVNSSRGARTVQGECSLWLSGTGRPPQQVAVAALRQTASKNSSVRRIYFTLTTALACTRCGKCIKLGYIRVYTHTARICPIVPSQLIWRLTTHLPTHISRITPTHTLQWVTQKLL